MASKTPETAEKALPLGRPGAATRLSEIEKELGKEKAEEIRLKAEKMARSAGRRSIGLEYVVKAEGKKMSADQLKEYRAKARGQAPAPKGTAKKKSSATTKKSSAKKSSSKKSSTATSRATKRQGSGRGNRKSAGSSSDRRATTHPGSEGSGQSKTDQLRELREAQAPEAISTDGTDTPADLS